MNKQWHVLHMDSDAGFRGRIDDYLGKHGYRVSVAFTGRDIRTKIERLQVDLLLLGPNAHGRADIDQLRSLRQTSDLPVILTDRGDDPGERIVALELGADDYLRHPFDLRELLARIRGFERRSLHPRGGPRTPPAYAFAGWTLMPDCLQLIDPQGRAVRLTATEHRLLLALVGSPRRVLGRARLLASLGNLNEESTERSIDMMIWRLRKKLGANLIRTERNAGYVFSAEVDTDSEQPGWVGPTEPLNLYRSAGRL